MIQFRIALYAALAAVLLAAGMSPALAQSTNAEAANINLIDEIVVSARKRDETSISVPVIITALTGAQLERRGVNSIDGLARMVPQLVIGEGGGTVQGGNIALRGIGGADANPFADQAVSFNVDGVQVARASVRRMAEMDLQQIEVLKGPQALFFGKNSPGGIISVRTADPTDQLTAKLSASHEFNAQEWRGEGYVSGPITESLGFRVAAYGSNTRGWVTNTVPRSSPFAPRREDTPKNDEFAVRGTLRFRPSDAFDAKLKVTYGEISSDSSSANVQYVDCPLGAPQSTGLDNCRADDQVSVGYVGPNFGAIDPRFGDGRTFLKQTQTLAGLEMNYHPGHALTLTSVTGYYDVRLRNLANFTASYIPGTMLPSFNRMGIAEISEELRLTSTYDGRFNFMVGTHFQESRAIAGSTTFFNATAPAFINNYLLRQKGTAWSAFGQGMYKLTDTLELSAGGRYSYEKKRLPEVRSGRLPGNVYVYPPPIVATVKDNDNWNNFSPEVTLTYRPSPTLTMFGSYKQGFLSGGFNSGSANFALPLDYDQETVKGFEIGVKSALLDGALRTNFAIYSYKLRGLQVQVTTQGTVQELKNAGAVSSKGAEFDFNWRTRLSGLSVHGALAYNRGRYDEYFGSCFRGQSKALGCSFVPRPGGAPGDAIAAATGQSGTLQDLGGTELLRAPKLTGNAGATYETPITTKLKLGLSADVTYSDSYFTDSTSKERARSPSYSLIDASIRIGDQDDRWEVALIGRNLTDKFYWTRNSDNPFTGTAPGNETGPAILGDSVSSISRGREIMLRLTAKFQ